MGARRGKLIILISVVVAVAGCGGSGSDVTQGEEPTATVTVTETATPDTDDPNDESPGEDTAGQQGAQEAQELTPGNTVTLGPDEDGGQVEVMLNSVSYPTPKDGDQLSSGRVLVALEMRIEHLAGGQVYGTIVYPDFETAAGQFIEDTGWVVGAFGSYGGGEFSEELPDTVDAGQFVQGWALYEVPPEPGHLVFPYGPGVFTVAVDPSS